MAQEIELKLRIPTSDKGQSIGKLSAYLNQIADPQGERVLANQYFDTPQRDLLQARAALRIRRKGDTYEQTLKTRGRSEAGMQVRNEWNWPIAGPELDESLLQQEEVTRCWPERADSQALEPVFSTDFNRLVWLWQDGENRIEVVLDQGQVCAWDRQESLCELELELLDGSPQCLWALLAELQTQVPLWISDVSKAERGYRLAGVRPQWQSHVDPDASEAEQLSGALVDIQRLTEATLWDGESHRILQTAVHGLQSLSDDAQLAELLEAFASALLPRPDMQQRAAAEVLGQISCRVWYLLSAVPADH